VLPLLFPTHSRNKATQVARKSVLPLCTHAVVVVIGTIRRIKTYLTLGSPWNQTWGHIMK